MNKLPLFFCLLLIFQSIQSYQIQNGYTGCPGQDIQTIVNQATPKLIEQSSHGKLYEIQNGENSLNLLVLNGDAKQMGTSAGQLQKTQIQQNVQNFELWVENNLETILKSINVPKFLAEMLGQYTVEMLESLLDLLSVATLPYTPTRYTDELKGMASGAGISYKSLRNFNLFRELFQGAGASALAGVWGKATENGELLTLRTLDWPVSSPLNDNPLITVYKSTEEGSYTFANFGYAGIIGAVSIVNSQGISIGDKVWFLDRNGEKVGWSYIGTPYQYVLRDMAQFGSNLENIKQQLEDSSRTVRLYVGVGSSQSNEYNGFQYSKKVLNSFDDQNYTQIYSDSHPQQDGVFYWDQYTQPSSNSCFSQIFEDNYGKINAQTLWQTVPGNAKTGISQIVVANLNDSIVQVAYGQNNQPAYLENPIEIDMSSYW